MLLSKITTLFTAALVGTAWSKPVELSRRALTQIGVRHMGQAEVDAIGSALKLVYDAAAGNQGGELGKGIYVSSSSLGFSYEQLHTVVSIEQSVWDGMKKLYIPETFNNEYILTNEDKIRAFITSKGEDPERVIRLKDDGMDPTFGQILIPAKLFEEGVQFSVTKPVKALDQIPNIHINMHDWNNVVEAETPAEEGGDEDSDSDSDDDDDDDDDDDGIF
ncbi:hypothetical protein LIA77_05158 [Sarocladium implicatum]|nr:hypothetical protein LIA77_05158 [Sarocladium implicatum]